MNKHFLEILEKSRAIHEKKAQDYTVDPTINPHENFERANLIASWFPDEYKSFAVLIGTKLARLGALLSSGRAPNNESVDDSFLDLLTYVGLMYSYYKDAQYPNQEQVQEQSQNLPDHYGQPKATIGEPEYIRGLGAELNPMRFAPVGCDGHAEEYHDSCGACRHKNQNVIAARNVQLSPLPKLFTDDKGRNICYHNVINSVGVCITCNYAFAQRTLETRYKFDQETKHYIRKV